MIRPLAPGETPAWKRLLAPLRYLLIQHEIKPRFDWLWPMILTAVTVGALWLLPVAPKFLGDAGILKGIRELIALLAAFFVAALAAVATFSRSSLDKAMDGRTPTLGGKDLTRRQFVCRLFGYLVFLSFTLFMCIVIAEAITPSLQQELSPAVMWWIKGVAGTGFAFMFWNMIVTTLLGVYFLTERVHIE